MYVYFGNFSETLLEVFLSQGIVTSTRVHFFTRLFLMTTSGLFTEIWTLVCCFHINISFFNLCRVPSVQYFLRPSGLHAFAVCICCPDVCTCACVLILFAYSAAALSFSGCSSFLKFFLEFCSFLRDRVELLPTFMHIVVQGEGVNHCLM